MPPVHRDPYAILGVERDATPTQVAHAYRALAKELHPDLQGDASAERMRQVNAAWEILSDPRKRAAWDNGQDVVAAGAHWSPSTAATGTAPPARAAPRATWTEWPVEPRTRPWAAYPRRPRPEERRRTDSPWLIVAALSLFAVGILVVAGIASLNGTKVLADSFEGFQHQVNPPDLNRTIAGSAIELRFGMRSFEGYDLLASGSPTSRDVGCGDDHGEPPDVQHAVNASTSSLLYDTPGHAYIYTWKTDASWAGTCRELTFTFRDGSSRSVLFDFRPVST